MNPQNPKTFPQKTTDKPDEYRNEKWEQTKSRVFKSNMGRFATTVGVDSDYPMADAKLISEEEYNIQLDERELPAIDPSVIEMFPPETITTFPLITLPPEIVRSPVIKISPGPFIVQLLSVKALCCIRVF